MKIWFKYSLFFLLFITFTLSAQTEDEKNKIRTTINTLFDICKKEDINEAAKLIAYNGLDKNRKYKSFYNINNRKEKNAVKRTVKKVKAMLSISDKFDIVNLSPDKSTSTITDVKIRFKSGTQEITSVFKFLKLDNRYVLAEIE